MVYRILGIKIKVRSKKRMEKQLARLAEQVAALQGALNAAAYQARSATRWNAFLWANEHRFTAKEYEWYVCQHFYEMTGYYPDLDNPRSFSEKISWLKLHYRHPLYERITDKYEFKEYVQEVLGEGWTIPLLGVWNRVEDIDFQALPDRFVLKSTTGGGGQYGIYVVKDKAEIDIDHIKYTFNDWIQEWMQAYYYEVAEPKHRETRIIAEEYMEDKDHQLKDYKFLCFHGEPKVMWIDSDRYNGHRRNVYDTEKRCLDVSIRYPNCPELAQELLPKHFDKMVELARKLAAPFPHIRVDFYEVDDKIYVGELTFHSEGGYPKITPREFDYRLGEYLDLSRLDKEALRNGLLPLGR